MTGKSSVIIGSNIYPHTRKHDENSTQPLVTTFTPPPLTIGWVLGATVWIYIYPPTSLVGQAFLILIFGHIQSKAR